MSKDELGLLKVLTEITVSVATLKAENESLKRERDEWKSLAMKLSLRQETQTSAKQAEIRVPRR